MASANPFAPGNPDCAGHTPLPVQDRAGATYCFNCIIARFQSPAYNLACRMLNDWAWAEDVTQDSFVSGYRAFPQFRGDNLSAWLMRIVANACRDALRSRRARPTIPLDPRPGGDDDPDNPAFAAANLPATTEGPEEYAERRELGRAIAAGLAALPAERRLAVLLVDVQGFSYEETAAILNCSIGTVKSRLSRGRRELRDYLRAAGELLPARYRQDN